MEHKKLKRARFLGSKKQVKTYVLFKAFGWEIPHTGKVDESSYSQREGGVPQTLPLKIISSSEGPPSTQQRRQGRSGVGVGGEEGFPAGYLCRYCSWCGAAGRRGPAGRTSGGSAPHTAWCPAAPAGGEGRPGRSRPPAPSTARRSGGTSRSWSPGRSTCRGTQRGERVADAGTPPEQAEEGRLTLWGSGRGRG